MNLSAPFIGRPVATTLLTVSVALAGAIAFSVLPVSPLPQVDFPTVSVSAGLPGASAEIMASSVATPLERQFSNIAGLTEMTSQSEQGSTSINLQFALNRDINAAARDVQAGINAARTYMPANLPSQPRWRKLNPADSPIMILDLSSDKYTRQEMYNAASTIIEQKLDQIEGVGQVTVGGSSLPAVRVDVNPTQLNSYGLTMADVRSLLAGENSDMAAGQISYGSTTFQIVTNGQITQAGEYRPLIVGYHNGQAVRLSQVAAVTDGAEDVRNAGYGDGKPAVFVIVFRQPNANIISTIERIKSELPFLKAVIPQGIRLDIGMDRTTTIRASLRDVEETLGISVVLVIFIVFVFLRNWQASLIPLVSVPISIVGTFAVMYLLGYSLDNLSLMALTIATGFVVDDAIVVMENISRHIEAGMSPLAASLKGSQEIGPTIFTMSTSLVAVFIPILLMGGIVGRLFHEFAVTMASAILISMMVSLVTTPTMCAHVLRAHAEQRHGSLFRASERFFTGMLATYRRALLWALDNRGLMLTVFLMVLALNVVIIYIIPKGFFPQQDTGAIMGHLQGPQDASFAVMNQSAKELVDTVMKDPAVAHTHCYVTDRGGFMYITLKPIGNGPEERKASAQQVIDRLQPKLDHLPVASVYLQAAQDIRVGARGSAALYEYNIESDSTADLDKWGPILLDHMKRIPGLQDVNTNQQSRGLDEYVTYNRVAAAQVGLTPQEIDTALYDSFGQSLASVMYEPQNQYYVVLEAAPSFWQSPLGLQYTYPAAGANGPVPLNAVAHAETTTIPIFVNHTGVFPSVTVSFNLLPGVAMSDATARVTRMTEQLNLPSTIHGFFSGTMEAYEQSLRTEPILILVAIMAVYIVLGILYESIVHPLTIISSLPSASAGAMLAIIATKGDLNVISIIGILLLIGLVKKNGIMLIDFALVAQREEGKSPHDAIFEACMLRFRPIIMTTGAAFFGALPLAFGTGTGSELRRPLGIAIAGGLIVSQMLTLFTTPVIYLYMDRLRIRSVQKRVSQVHVGQPGHEVT
ncbi:MAG: efflux RND transporter permease subunit [Candidatus Acidiferrales bacterium]